MYIELLKLPRSPHEKASIIDSLLRAFHNSMKFKETKVGISIN